MAFTSNEALSYNIPFDTRLEVLSLHSYDDRIKAREEERKMKDSILFDFYEQELKTVGSYVNALERLNSIDTLESYLGNHVVPVVADWPGQIFIRNAIRLCLRIRIIQKFRDLPQTLSPYRSFLLMDSARNAWKDVKPIVVNKFGKCCKDLEYLFLLDQASGSHIWRVFSEH
ncbi:6429_t:CDS:2, partial [Gigaspora rosea]